MKLPFKRKKMPWPVAVILTIPLACMLTLGALALQTNPLEETLANLSEWPMAALWNVAPVFLLLLASLFLFSNLFFSTAFVGVVVLGFSLINRLKIEIRDEPLNFQDLFLYREGLEAAKSYAIDWPWELILPVALAVLVLILLGIFIGMKKPRFRVVRLVLFLLPLALLPVMTNTVIADTKAYGEVKVSNDSYMPAVYNEHGTIYSFLHYITHYKVQEPEGYDESEARAWNDAKQEDAGEGAAVNVVFIQNEAFSDISNWQGFDYAEKDDPLKNFHALANDEHALSGHIVVPQFAGGTANTEFDVLTGMQTIHAASSAFRTVHHNVGSLFRIFDRDGYETSMVHPGEAWFYNRENVYRYFGAEDIRFEEDLGDVERLGNWVSDDAMADEIIRMVNNAHDSGTLLFNECVTIQNHMAYTYGKYDSEDGIIAVPLDEDVEMSDADRYMLAVYMKGVRDADAMIGKLAEAYRESTAPVVFVFYGDHLPYLGDNQSVYKALGKDFSDPYNSASTLAFETPYLIWANDAAAAAMDWDARVDAAQIPKNISACYLGASMLELVGRDAEDPWFDYLTTLRAQYPVMTTDSVRKADGTTVAIEDLSAEERAPLEKYWKWAYYRLNDDQVEDE